MRRRKAIHPAGRIPAWATAIVASADTQKDHYWYMVRAWGPGYRSRLVDFGRVETLDDLRRATLEARWPVEGTDRQAGAVRLVTGLFERARYGDRALGAEERVLVAREIARLREVPWPRRNTLAKSPP